MGALGDIAGADRSAVDCGTCTLSVQQMGPADGEPVILWHGFPELGYSWRHQAAALADAAVLSPEDARAIHEGLTAILEQGRSDPLVDLHDHQREQDGREDDVGEVHAGRRAGGPAPGMCREDAVSSAARA